MIKILFETKLTDVASSDIEGVGTLRYGPEGQVCRWVKNRSATTAIAAKEPVCYDEAKVGSSALFESVEVPTAGNVMLAAGLAITAIVASASDALCFGWITVQGYFQDAVLQPTATIVGIGDELDATSASVNLDFLTTDGTAPAYSNHYVALEVVTTTSTVTEYAKDVFVKCL